MHVMWLPVRSRRARVATLDRQLFALLQRPSDFNQLLVSETRRVFKKRSVLTATVVAAEQFFNF